jgi:hypothetical protein
MLETILLQSSDRSLLRAELFVGGLMFMRLVQGIVFGMILGSAVNSISIHIQSAVISPMLITVLGILLLVNAFINWEDKEHPGGSMPKWLKMIDSITPLEAFGIGLLMVATSPPLRAFTLSGIAVISEAQRSLPYSILLYLLFVLLAELMVLLPFCFRVIRPKLAEKFLNGISAWLTQNTRLLIMATSLVFGLYFLVKGVSGLLTI